MLAQGWAARRRRRGLPWVVDVAIMNPGRGSLNHVRIGAVQYIEHTDTGVSAIWIFANISYSAMRAQNHPSTVWRIITFIFGFPGTLLSMLIIREGECNAYGIHFPKRPGQ